MKSEISGWRLKTLEKLLHRCAIGKCVKRRTTGKSLMKPEKVWLDLAKLCASPEIFFYLSSERSRALQSRACSSNMSGLSLALFPPKSELDISWSLYVENRDCTFLVHVLLQASIALSMCM